jgi:hypothetical protein
LDSVHPIINQIKLKNGRNDQNQSVKKNFTVSTVTIVFRGKRFSLSTKNKKQRKKMKILLLLSSLFCVVKSLPISDLKIYPKAKWTVAVYMNGDNELEPTITGGEMTADFLKKTFPQGWSNPNRNLADGETYTAPGDFHTELAVDGSNEDVHVVALVDRTPGFADNMDDWTNTRLYYVRKGDYPDNTRGLYWTNTTVSSDGELDMAQTSTLEWFLSTVSTYFPSDHLYLSMWDHNWAWHNGYFQRDLTSDNDTMNYIALSTMLTSFQVSHPSFHIDVIGYDACVSSHMEVLHTWKDIASTFAGSQDYVDWGGVDYGIVIKAIHQNPMISAEDLSIIIAKSMLTDEEDKCATAVTFSDTGKSFEALTSAIDHLGSSFIEYLPEIKSQLATIRRQVEHVPTGSSDVWHLDLYSLANTTMTVLGNRYPKIQDASQQIISQMKSSILFNEVKEKMRSCRMGKGLSIYWPLLQKEYESEYASTTFGKRTKWDDFLSKYLNAGSV